MPTPTYPTPRHHPTARLDGAEAYGYTLVVREHDGHRRDDGSHLTGSGPAFAEAMVARKLMYRY